MSTKYETSHSQYFSSSADPSLRAYFGRVRKGSDKEIRTDFAKGVQLQNVLDEWSNSLKSLKEDWPTLWNFEDDLRKKVGPLSIMKPLSERMDDIESYYTDINLPSVPIPERALKAVLQEWSSCSSMRIRGQARTVDLMKKSTNSGSPFFTRRRTIVHDTFPAEVILNGNEVVQTLNGHNYMSCALLGWRGQEGGPTDQDVKQRVVWMFPFALNACELQLYQPLIEGAQRNGLVPAWISNEAVDRMITNMFDSKQDKDLIVCTDFSKFDQHFNPACQDAAYEIIKRLFHTDPLIESWLQDVFPIKYMIPLMYDYNTLRRGKHGMASGSGGTNADETLVHRALQYEAAQSQGKFLNVCSQCLGDDGILTFPGITVDKVLEVYTSHGLEMNADKQYASTDDCVYLRRWHHKSYRVDGIAVGVYSTYRALGRLAERERTYKLWSEKLDALRELSIMENVKFHPLREQFVNFVMERSAYRLGLSIPGFFDDLERTVREATDYMEDFLGYNRTQMDEQQGINSWWIVNHLKSMR